ncbi:MAG: type II toxin-antitoxin system VapC family toxin [Thermofilaceae archaeon]
MRRRGSSKRIYVDVNVFYYYLTANPEFGERAKWYLEKYSGFLATSSLSVWLLYVLTRVKDITSILEEVGVELLPLDVHVLKAAGRLEKPRDFEDRIHLATAKIYGITTIISNDEDFDGITGIERVF